MNPAVRTFRNLVKDRASIDKECYPAFDELLSFSLERRYLSIPALADMMAIVPAVDGESLDLSQYLQKNVCLFKVDEIAFDVDEKCHLAGVESAVTSMRNCGYSLVFVVQGDLLRTSVYMGVARFSGALEDILPVAEGYKATWEANFPGSKFEKQSKDEAREIADRLGDCKAFGVLTGIPSLKREDETIQFVQGLERLIRAMRGKTYCWISIADPIPENVVRDSIDQCQRLQSDIHHLVKTDLTESTSNGKTIMLGGFGMIGKGTTNGTARTKSIGEAQAKSTVQNKLEGYQRIGNVCGLAGSIVGTLITGGTPVGTAAGALVGKIVGGLVNDIGGAITGKNGYSEGTTLSKTLGSADTISKALSKQASLGGFGSVGLTITKTTSAGQELLNRKAEYTEETLKAYEDRLHDGVAIGMWNLGHYFCAKDEDTFTLGSGIVSSLFTGMDSRFETPRTIRVPESFREVLCRFNNVYLQFSDADLTEGLLRDGGAKIENHPLGVVFNGPATPVTTKELAIATPIATADVEGVTTSVRASFGVNMPRGRGKGKTVTLGTILDRGSETKQRFRLGLENLPKHLAVFGLTGSGKTNTVHNLLHQLWKVQRIPFMVIEPAKAEYRALSRLPELKDSLLVFSAGVDQSSVCPLRLNPFDFNPGKDDDAHRVHILTHIDRLKSVFNASFPMYASMPYILEEAILDVYRERGWDLARSMNRYVDIYSEDFKEYIPTIHDLYLKVESIVRRKGYFKEQEMNIMAALKSRLSSLMVGAKGTMFNCKGSIPDSDLFENPVVIELENMGDDDEKAFLMGLLVTRLYEYRKVKFNAEDLNLEHPFSHLLVIEEAHRLLANVPDTSANMEVANVKGKSVASFVDMLSEIRAFGQSVFIVDQLPSRVSPNIVKGTGAKIVHRLLAKDDREFVGKTMGLTGNQIEDLSLLRTGECVVSQDGDRKSFLCQVEESDVHQRRTGGEVSSATTEYKARHQDLFKIKLEDFDLSNDMLRGDLYRTMLALGMSQANIPTADIFAWARDADETVEDFIDRLGAYWEQVSRSMWNYYGGRNFRQYLKLKSSGLTVLQGASGSLQEYQKAMKEFFADSPVCMNLVGRSIAGVAYAQLFAITSVIRNVKSRFDAIKDCPDSVRRFALAIAQVIKALTPRNKELEAAIKATIVREIVESVNPAIPLAQVMDNI